MKILVKLLLPLLLICCSSTTTTLSNLSKAEKVKQQLEGAYFEFNLYGGSFVRKSTLKLYENTFIFTDLEPVIFEGIWAISANGKYLLLESKKEKILNTYYYSQTQYQFKIKNSNTLIWKERKFLYKRISDPSK